ncbi:MAG: hypothetical protein KC543_16000 [Myxococcales bacterium]|nr:hypothetical protein [Myxococcales bacterium]
MKTNNLRAPMQWAAILGACALMVGCNSGPAPEDACTVGSNGGEPVIIVAGTFSPGIANQLFLGNALHAKGYTYCVFELEGDSSVADLPGTASEVQSAAGLASFVDSVKAWSGSDKVDLVGHSQGATVARWYLKFDGGTQNVDTYISLAGPQHGTDLAALTTLLQPALSAVGLDPEDIQPFYEMQQGSDFTNALNDGDPTPGNVDYYAFYSSDDQLVWQWDSGLFGIPFMNRAAAATIDGATNVKIQDQCFGRYVSHLGEILDPAVFEMVDDALQHRSIHVNPLTCLLPPVPSPI